MLNQELTSIRHPGDTALLERALNGEIAAVRQVFHYLNTANPNLQTILKETLHDFPDDRLWEVLLNYLAFGVWPGVRRQDTRSEAIPHPEAAPRVRQAISEVFACDESPHEKAIKETLLYSALHAAPLELRRAAAVLFAQRGNPAAIPWLEEILEKSPLEWKLRAIEALGRLPDEGSAFPLLKALAFDREEIHRAARTALARLGGFAEPAYLVALSHPNSHIRWHAACGLGHLGNARGIGLLAEGLVDENPDVRWATADALAQVGEAALPAVLSVIMHHSLNEPLRTAAVHALRALLTRRTRPVLEALVEALSSPSTSLRAPTLAQRALEEWQSEARDRVLD